MCVSQSTNWNHQQPCSSFQKKKNALAVAKLRWIPIELHMKPVLIPNTVIMSGSITKNTQ